jgi:hypothetical protein
MRFGFPAELTSVYAMLRERGAILVAVGHADTTLDTAVAHAFAGHWRRHGGEISTIVSWPHSAASWQRPALRLVAGAPDAWVVSDSAAGWRRIGPRLVATGRWRARDTFAFDALADHRLPALAGHDATEGLSVALPDGQRRTFRDGCLTAGHGGREWTR